MFGAFSWKWDFLLTFTMTIRQKAEQRSIMYWYGVRKGAKEAALYLQNLLSPYMELAIPLLQSVSGSGGDFGGAGSRCQCPKGDNCCASGAVCSAVSSRAHAAAQRSTHWEWCKHYSEKFESRRWFFTGKIQCTTWKVYNFKSYNQS